MSLACLDTLIGLAPESCGCLDAAPAGFNTSDSGYYLNDPEFGYPVLSSALANANCIAGTAWDVLDAARQAAILDFKADLQSVLRKELRNGLYSWSGTMGETKANRGGTTTQAYAGLLLRPKARAIDAYFTITALWAGFGHTGTVDVEIGSNTIGFTPVSATLNTTANKFVRNVLAEPVSLPLYDTAQQGLAYTITYDPTGLTARLNMGHCGGCGSRPGWTTHIEATGWRSDTAIADVDTSYIPRQCLSQWQGLAVEGHFGCSRLDYLCRLDEMGGADMTSLLARAIQYKAAIRLMLADQAIHKVNQFTLLNADSRAARISAFQEGYFNILQFISQNTPAGATSCWGCSKAQPVVAMAIK